VPLRLRERRRIGHDHRRSGSDRGVSGQFWIPLTKRERDEHEHEHDAAAVVPIVTAVLVKLLQLPRNEGRALRSAIVATAATRRALGYGGGRQTSVVRGVFARDADVWSAGSAAGGALLGPAV
jgi:hypothetical protein